MSKKSFISYKIILTSQAKKELKKLSKLDKLSVGEIIEELKDDPLIGKPLTRELTDRFSYRVGVYRVIYKIKSKDKLIEVLSAGHRSTAYN